MRKLEFYSHPMIHPFYKLTKYKRDQFQKWRHYHTEKGVDPGCYGFYLLSQATRSERAAQSAMRVQAKAAAATRIRPSWCSKTQWRNWRSYQYVFAPGIPLLDYLDPAKRREWLGKRKTRPITPREAAAELLRRKGLAP